MISSLFLLLGDKFFDAQMMVSSFYDHLWHFINKILPNQFKSTNNSESKVFMIVNQNKSEKVSFINYGQSCLVTSSKRANLYFIFISVARKWIIKIEWVVTDGSKCITKLCQWKCPHVMPIEHVNNWSFYDWLFRRPAMCLKGEFLDKICETCENIDNQLKQHNRKHSIQVMNYRSQNLGRVLQQSTIALLWELSI